MEMLGRQLAEIEALRSMYPDEALVHFTAEEEATLSAAQTAVDSGGGDETASTFPSAISGRVTLEDVQVEGEPVVISFQFPGSYPLLPPSFRILCSSCVPRGILDELTAALCEQALALNGEESLLLCLDHAKTLVQELIDAGQLSPLPPPVARKPTSVAAPSWVLKRTAVWFHHIKSGKKRRSMCDWAGDLRLGGWHKIGYPGVCMVEGAAEDVDYFIGQLRSQKWKAMAVRCELEEQCESAVDMQDKRRFPAKYMELGEGGLGQLAEMCRAVELGELFDTVLKLET